MIYSQKPSQQLAMVTYQTILVTMVTTITMVTSIMVTYQTNINLGYNCIFVILVIPFLKSKHVKNI